ncbi:MAG: 6-bladed beta-propeller [Acidobacteria bacterium]|nr:6-bladed beta-propeller [Acidobacteriota bacterium]
MTSVGGRCATRGEQVNRKRLFRALTITMTVGVLAAMDDGVAQQPTIPQIRFKAETPLVLPPDLHFGETAGVGVNSQGHVFVFSRGNSASGPAFGATASQLLEFEGKGKFVREIGKNLAAWSYAHSVRIDKDDNIWAVDKGSNVVVKFNPAGRVIAIYGRRDEPTHGPHPSPQVGPAPVHRDGIFDQPTDIAWNSAGDAFITDGYVNARVAKLNKDGAWVKSWGERGTGPGQFYTPHAVAVDARDNVYIGDRGNARVQVFNSNGEFLRQFTVDALWLELAPGTPNANPIFWTPPQRRRDDPTVPKAYPRDMPMNLTRFPGAPDAMCIPPGPDQVLFVADVNPSRIYKVSLEGKILGVLGEPGEKLGQFLAMHGLACPSANTLWVADMLNWRVQKLTLDGGLRTTSQDD